MAWFDDNAPDPAQPGPQDNQAGGGGGSSWNQGGGWDQGGLSPAAQALQAAFAKGLTGQAAVDDANQAAGLKPPNSISFGGGGYGLPGGQYVAPNAAKGGQLDLITRGGGGDDGGGFSMAPGWGSGTQAPDLFVAPTGLNYQNDPGYVERMKMGTQALQGAAAAKGSVLSGGTLKALERYGQDYGSNEYGNVYGRAAQGYQINAATQRNAQQDYWARLNSLYQGGQAANRNTYQPPPA